MRRERSAADDEAAPARAGGLRQARRDLRRMLADSLVVATPGDGGDALRTIFQSDGDVMVTLLPGAAGQGTSRRHLAERHAHDVARRIGAMKRFAAVVRLAAEALFWALGYLPLVAGAVWWFRDFGGCIGFRCPGFEEALVTLIGWTGLLAAVRRRALRWGARLMLDLALRAR